MSNLKSLLETGHVLPEAPWEMPHAASGALIAVLAPHSPTLRDEVRAQRALVGDPLMMM